MPAQLTLQSPIIRRKPFLYEDGLHLDFRAPDPLCYVKAPGAQPVVRSVTAFFDNLCEVGNQSMYLRGGKLQQAQTNIPRIAHDWDGSILGLMTENAATNLFTFSSDLSNAIWRGVFATKTPNAAVSPELTLNALVLNEGAANNAHYLDYNAAAIVAANTSVAFSVWFKQRVGQRHAALLLLGAGGGNFLRGFFDLTRGVFHSSQVVGDAVFENGYCEKFPGGWWRLTLCGKFSATVALDTPRVEMCITPGVAGAYQGENAEVEIYGPQLTTLAIPNSYIPTGAGTVTRTQDRFKRNDAENILTNAAGTTRAEYILRTKAPTTVFGYWLCKDDGANFSPMHYLSTSAMQASITDNASVATKANTPSLVAPLSIVHVTTYGPSGNKKVTYNGASAIVSNAYSGSIFNGNIIRVGHRLVNTDPPNGFLRRLNWWPREVSDAELIALSR